MTEQLLSVSDLTVHFHTPGGRVRAVDGVSFEVGRDETVCLVGESGAGKTVLCETITGLLDSSRAEVDGRVTFDGDDLTSLSGRALRRYRGSRIGHVFQNPQGALDPVYTVGRQVTEAVRNGSDRSKAAARERALELLEMVELPDPPAVADEYPHELSGGMKQRVAVAMALAGDPDLLIADEPTTALDVTIEASLVRLLSEIQEEMGTSILYVTHDLGIVAELADRITVMYAGKVMETGGVYETFERPAHPYTQALLRCRPGWGQRRESIGGSPPDPVDPPEGCRFHSRCRHAIDACREGDQPPLYDVEVGGNRTSCVFYDGYRDRSVVRDAWDSGTADAPDRPIRSPASALAGDSGTTEPAGDPTETRGGDGSGETDASEAGGSGDPAETVGEAEEAEETAVEWVDVDDDHDEAGDPPGDSGDEN